ncbi:Fe-S cluster assembly protein SufB [Candidatus Woesearchaeota archaeon]|nr:Fe-S cluster assembly protein SufB [Candidatus Woesearchaeota archaeon]
MPAEKTNQDVECVPETTGYCAAYDLVDKEHLLYKAKPGISEDLVREISKSKGEPEWMLKTRLEGLKAFHELSMPSWGPDLSDLDVSKIHLFLRPDAKKNASDWSEVPEDIKKTYARLGLLQAEKENLSGLGAQYESEVVYRRLKSKWVEQGVIFMSTDEAVQQFPEMVRKYFMTTCVPVRLHKFSALHAALWSGGTFIYVPKGVKVNIPLHSYFRMNARKGGQFEHTLIIVDEGAEVQYIEGCSAPSYPEYSLHSGCIEIHVLKGGRARFSSIENWSKNTYSFNTVRAVVHDGGLIEWVSGSLGSKTLMLYPCSLLVGNNSKSHYLGIAYAGKGQHKDAGCKVYHVGKNTSSTIVSKCICKDGGVGGYRGLVNVKEGALYAKSSVSCETLMMDETSRAGTYPVMKVAEKSATVAHEATVGRISDEQLFYLMSRGMPKDSAIELIVSGFAEPIAKELPLEYAAEFNRLIALKMEGQG